MDTLQLLRDLGIDPAGPRMHRAIELIRSQCDWGEEFDNSPFFEGEVEPCINGRVLGIGAYFGQASPRLLERLLREPLSDGGWNCDAPPSRRSSFHSTICVLEGLLDYELAVGPTTATRDASLRGQAFLVERNLFKSKSTGQAIDFDRKLGRPVTWMDFSFPPRWHYDVLRGLDYLRSAGVKPDARLDEAIDLVVRKRDRDGRWPLDAPYPGRGHFEMEHPGQPSRWNTLRAMRVLAWAGR